MSTLSAEEKALAAQEVDESVAVSLLGDFLRTRVISDDDAQFLKARYLKLHEIFVSIRKSEQDITKKIKNVVNEILNEKILLEKSRLEEAEETSNLRKIEENRNALQKELDFTEQKETVAKFELAELKKVHEELTEAVVAVRQENNDLVIPILTSLKQQITDAQAEIVETDEQYDKEMRQKEILLVQVENLETIRKEKDSTLLRAKEHLSSVSEEPKRIQRQIDAISKAVEALTNELRMIERNIAAVLSDKEKQAKKSAESLALQKTLMEKLTLHRTTIEEREQDVAVLNSNLDSVKAKNQDLLSEKADMTLKKKDCDTTYRHTVDEMSSAKKEYDSAKRELKKKQVICNSVRQLIPTLEAQLKDAEALLETYRAEKEVMAKELSRTKEDKDVLMANFFQQEGLEAGRKAELEAMLSEVDQLEASVVTKMSENKRQGKLLQVLSAQRDIISRECARLVHKEKEARNQIRIKELTVLDETKKCNEIANRHKEFSALYDVVKNERNKYVSLIQISMQALAEMKEKIRILNNEVEILSNESAAKDIALSKEQMASLQASSQRDKLRQDLNRLLSDYRSKQNSVEQQIQEIDKLNNSITVLEREMLEIKNLYEKAVDERNMVGVQLIDRNDELCILYERSNQQQEASRKGEMTLMKLDEELRLIKLQTEELKRQYNAARKRLPELDINRSRIVALEERLNEERKRTEEVSIQLEDPQNLDRWLALEGDDPDMEQLHAKTVVLEDRLDKKREQLLEKELIFEEVSALTEKLRNQAVSKRDGSKYLGDQLNGLQRSIRETTKKMLASVSELSMYQASALRLQQEKFDREKEFEECKWRVDHGEAPDSGAIKDWNRHERKKTIRLEASMRREEEAKGASGALTVKTAAEPRPTAYIPDEVGLPKPYGAMAPFKPSEAGAQMRHFRLPNPKPIEI